MVNSGELSKKKSTCSTARLGDCAADAK